MYSSNHYSKMESRKPYIVAVRKEKKSKWSWPTALVSVSCFLEFFVGFDPIFALAHWRVMERKTQFMADTKQFPAATLLVQSCISSKRMKEEIEQKVYSWGLTVEGKHLWTRLLKCSPDLCLLTAIEFSYLIVATKVRAYRRFSFHMREQFKYSEE